MGEYRVLFKETVNSHGNMVDKVFSTKWMTAFEAMDFESKLYPRTGIIEQRIKEE